MMMMMMMMEKMMMMMMRRRRRRRRREEMDGDEGNSVSIFYLQWTITMMMKKMLIMITVTLTFDPRSQNSIGSEPVQKATI